MASDDPDRREGTPADAPVRIVLADDHLLFLEGLERLLDNVPGFSVVGTATGGRAALEVLRRERPDVALIDITMPDLNGLDVVREASATLPDVKTLVLTMHDEEAFFFEALRAGAAGYLLKGVGGDELVSAINAVMEGGVYIPPQLAPSLVREATETGMPAGGGPSNEPLTPREEEIVRLIAQGLTNKEIADQLIVSLNTVKTHRLRLYQKLKLHSRSELVAFALRKGILR